ncbi:MAG: DUF1028 domain-containing protein [Planctomycetota bacterium]|jgi:hypothetical protein|nr:DUF1028 domain-containing protein [Planctomycetota bacterium]
MGVNLQSAFKPLISALCVLVLSTQAFATWSIIVVNTRTQEIIVASATCVESINLRAALAMLEAQAGGGCAQSIGASIIMRQDASEMLALGVPPEEILQALSTYDNLHELRQYGFVDLAGRAATFTGVNCGDWAGGLTGQSGDLVYAIQGNVLTGQPVIDAAEQALLNTSGDMAQKVMAAMEAARDMGGDGRCSCSNSAPTSCGAPPAAFVKSAHVGFMISARPGDHPFCDNFACAKGDLYLVINKASLSAPDPDPVTEMRLKFDSLRLALIGRPDAYLSQAYSYQSHVAANSQNPVAIVLDLADVDGNMLTAGGAAISLAHTSRSSGLATLHQVTDHNDGTYTVEVMPGNDVGVDELLFVVDDGIRPVTLWPPTTLVHEQTLAPLMAEQGLPGLQGINAEFARFNADGLTCYVVGDRGAGLEFLQLTRPDWQSSFNVVAPITITNFPLTNLKSFWISEDGLRLTISAQHQGRADVGLFATTRTTVNDDFPQPIVDLDLNTNRAEGGPFLSANELEIWFHSTHDYSSSIWFATRQSKDARWYPPQRYQPTANQQNNGYPMFANNGGELIFAEQLPSASGFSLRHARVTADGSIGASQLLPGVDNSRNIAKIPIGLIVDPQSQSRALCVLKNNQLLQTPLADDVLQVSPSSVSLATGGTFTLQTAAGANFNGANFNVFVGDLAANAVDLGVLPIKFNRHFSSQLKSQLSNASGTLNANGNATTTWTIAPGMSFPPQLINYSVALSAIARTPLMDLISNAVIVKVEP